MVAQLRDRDEFLADIRDRLLLAEDVMKAHYDKQHRFLEFQVGEWAWLKLHQRVASGITPARSSKLGPCYFGPFQILV